MATRPSGAPDDEELLDQLARLDALEERQLRAAAGKAELSVDEPPLFPPEELPQHPAPAPVQPAPAVEATWPPGITQPPSPADGLTAYASWVEEAAAILTARASRNREDLAWLASQWAHVARDPSRFRTEDVSALMEGQARARERIAADSAAALVLVDARERLAGVEQASNGPAIPPGLVRRLLDDGAAERAAAARAMIDGPADVVTAVSADIDAVTAQAKGSPKALLPALEHVRERLRATATVLRDAPTDVVDVEVAPGEGLQAALRRALHSCADRVTARLRWSGPEPDEDVGAAIAWIVRDCLRHLVTTPGERILVAVEAASPSRADLNIMVASPALSADGEDPPWLVRIRARATLARGTVSAQRTAEGSVVEVRLGR